MKKIISITLTALLSFAAGYAQSLQSFRIEGNVANTSIAIQKVYIYYMVGMDEKQDSCAVSDSKYSFKGQISGPTYMRMQARAATGADPEGEMIEDSMRIYTELFHNNKIKNLPPEFAEKAEAHFKKYEGAIFVEPGVMDVNSKGDFTGFQVRGSASQPEYAQLEKESDAFTAAHIKPLSVKLSHNDGDTVRGKALMDELGRQQKALERDVYLHFAETHPRSFVSLYALQRAGGMFFNAGMIDTAFRMLSPVLRESYEGKQMEDKIKKTLAVAIGKPAPDFVQPDTAGRPVRLSSFRGKYVLLDFWASWCMPCRMESPFVVKAYNKYKGMNFTILSISFDKQEDRDKWLKAIYKDGVQGWTHASDLQSWKNAAGRMYNIEAIPSNFLIDPAGKIIAVDLRGEELDKKLKEVLGG